jgi:hypothetical protein
MYVHWVFQQSLNIFVTKVCYQVTWLTRNIYTSLTSNFHVSDVKICNIINANISRALTYQPLCAVGSSLLLNTFFFSVYTGVRGFYCQNTISLIIQRYSVCLWLLPICLPIVILTPNFNRQTRYPIA